MGIFHRITNSFARFMYGRNGMDKLGMTTVWGSMLVYLLSVMLLRRHRVAGSLLYYLALAGMLWSLFRMFSKNLGRRREENQKYVNWVWRSKSSWSSAKARRADTEHKYFTCKNCKTICRVPVGKGKVVITCPKCGAEIHGKT